MLSPNSPSSGFIRSARPRLDLRELAEPLDGPTVAAFQHKARELGIVIVINLYERDGDHTFDSSPVIDADGTLLGVTRMIHITEYACFHEQGYYTPGDKGAPVFATKAGKIGVAICYDRHFPEYMRALALDGADLVIVPQAGAVDEWPEGLYEGEMRVAAFQTATSSRCATASGRKTVWTSPANRSSSPTRGRSVARGREEAQRRRFLYARTVDSRTDRPTKLERAAAVP